MSGVGKDRGFEAWFGAYPAHRREARSRAWRAWNATQDQRPPLGEMLATLAVQRRSRRWHAEGGRFVPAAWNYLLQARWADDWSAYPPVDSGAAEAGLELDVPRRLGRLAAALPEALAAREGWASRIAALAGGPAEVVEEQLKALNPELMKAAWAGLDEEQRRLVAGVVEVAAGAVAGRLPPQRLAACREQLRNHEVRRRLGCPVLSLFSPEAKEVPG